MISPLVAATLIFVGVLLALLCVTYGAILHMRYIDRKLMKPQPKQVTQGNGVSK